MGEIQAAMDSQDGWKQKLDAGFRALAKQLHKVDEVEAAFASTDSWRGQYCAALDALDQEEPAGKEPNAAGEMKETEPLAATNAPNDPKRWDPQAK